MMPRCRNQPLDFQPHLLLPSDQLGCRPYTPLCELPRDVPGRRTLEWTSLTLHLWLFTSWPHVGLCTPSAYWSFIACPLVSVMDRGSYLQSRGVCPTPDSYINEPRIPPKIPTGHTVYTTLQVQSLIVVLRTLYILHDVLCYSHHFNRPLLPFHNCRTPIRRSER